MASAGENEPFGPSHLGKDTFLASRYQRMAVLGTIGIGLALTQYSCANDASETTAAPVIPSPTQTTPARAGDASATATTTGDSSGSSRSGQPSVSAEGSDFGDITGTTVTVHGCLNDDVKVEVTFQPQAVRGQHRSGLVTVTNASDHTCKVRGHFAMLLVNAADEPVDVSRKGVDKPGKAITVTVEPGRSAFAGIKWTVCDKTASDCGVGNRMRFNLQNSTDDRAAELIDFPAADKNALAMSSLQIGTLQPSSQGVVAW